MIILVTALLLSECVDEHKKVSYIPQTESAHLTWLYRTVQKAFQSETVLGVDCECDKDVRTAAPSGESV